MVQLTTKYSHWELVKIKFKLVWTLTVLDSTHLDVLMIPLVIMTLMLTLMMIHVLILKLASVIAQEIFLMNVEFVEAMIPLVLVVCLQ